jgi:hypothetical protein
LLGLPSCGQFNDVRKEEMAWNKGKEDRPKNDILLPIVVTLDADKDAILQEDIC